MLYMKCPTCKSLLGHKQIYYEENFDNITRDYEMKKISHSEMEKKKKELLDFLFPNKDKYCCRMRTMTYVRLIDLIV